jgi:hypothetical protein
MGRYIKMQHASTIVSQREEYEPDSKADSRNYEEIDGYHCFEVIFEKRAPSLRGWLAAVDHMPGNGCLRGCGAVDYSKSNIAEIPSEARQAQFPV